MEKTTTPYEFLVRWKPETGEFSGAQLVNWQKIVIDDEVIKNEPASPIAVSFEDLPAEIAKINAAAIQRVSELETEISQHEDDISALLDRIAALTPKEPEDDV